MYVYVDPAVSRQTSGIISRPSLRWVTRRVRSKGRVWERMRAQWSWQAPSFTHSSTLPPLRFAQFFIRNNFPPFFTDWVEHTLLSYGSLLVLYYDINATERNLRWNTQSYVIHMMEHIDIPHILEDHSLWLQAFGNTLAGNWVVVNQQGIVVRVPVNSPQVKSDHFWSTSWCRVGTPFCLVGSKSSLVR